MTTQEPNDLSANGETGQQTSTTASDRRRISESARGIIAEEATKWALMKVLIFNGLVAQGVDRQRAVQISYQAADELQKEARHANAH